MSKEEKPGVNTDALDEIKIKMAPKTQDESSVYKVDLSNNIDKPKAEPEDEAAEPVDEGVEVPEELNEVKPEAEPEGEGVEPKQEIEEEESIVERITDEDVEPEKKEDTVEDVVEEDVKEEEPKQEYPEDIQKLVDFMNETNGTLEDYIRLNADYSNVDENTLLREYYKHTKSNLDSDDIDFLIEDKFSYDEDSDDERDIKRKKLNFKEEVAKAKEFLNGVKEKYYTELKSGKNLAPEVKEAVDFHNEYKVAQQEQAELRSKQGERFDKLTNELLSNDFKGFEFKVGDEKFRYKVKDVQNVKEVQSDLLNSFKTFLDDDGLLKDAAGFHRALFAARNADQIASHFYEQGKADAVKDVSAKSKNINMDPRKTSSGVVEVGGTKVRVVSGNDSSRLTIKSKKH